MAAAVSKTVLEKLSEERLRMLARIAQTEANDLQREAAAKQRRADCLRKELKRRKRAR